jgi:hypothetical protein
MPYEGEGAEQQKIMYCFFFFSAAFHRGMQHRINSDLVTRASGGKRWYHKECHQRGNTEDYDGEIYKEEVNAEEKYFFLLDFFL